MKLLLKICCAMATLVTLNALAADPFLELDRVKYGVSVTRERSVMDYAATSELGNQDSRLLRILVTTQNLTPDAETYAIAASFSEGLKQSYPLVQFKIFGRVDNQELAKMIREEYDYAFIIRNIHRSSDYERDETVYGSRSSGVNCSRSVLNGDVNCRETGSQSVPIGTRQVQSTIFTDKFFADYGSARQVGATWLGDSFIPALTVVSAIGRVGVTIRYAQSDTFWCDDEVKAQTLLAQLAGMTAISSRPDKVSFNVDPDDIGCNG